MSNEWLHETPEEQARRLHLETRHRLAIEAYSARPQRGTPWGVLLLFAFLLLGAGLAVVLVADQIMSRP